MKYTLRDLVILSMLRSNSRISLTTMSRKTGIPVSTLFDKLKHFDFIKKYTVLIEYNKLGLNSRAFITICLNKQQKQEFLKYVKNNPNVNNIMRINNGYDFMLDVIFRNLKETEDFIEGLESKWDVIKKNVYYIIDEIQNEDFLSTKEVTTLLLKHLLKN